MIVYPAIDLSGGACVRLRRGDFAERTTYSNDPLEQVRAFASEGAEWVHVVDLDGARDGDVRQTDTILDLARTSGVALQVGGGLRDAAHIATLLSGGVSRVVVGSTALEAPERTRGWLARFGADRIALAFDVRMKAETPFPAMHGWRRDQDVTLWDWLDRYSDAAVGHVVVTDIGRDGMLAGPHVDLYEEMGRRFPDIDVIASGGVSALADLEALARIPVAGAIVGKALYEKRFSLAEALSC